MSPCASTKNCMKVVMRLPSLRWSRSVMTMELVMEKECGRVGSSGGPLL